MIHLMVVTKIAGLLASCCELLDISEKWISIVRWLDFYEQ